MLVFKIMNFDYSIDTSKASNDLFTPIRLYSTQYCKELVALNIPERTRSTMMTTILLNWMNYFVTIYLF